MRIIHFFNKADTEILPKNECPGLVKNEDNMHVRGA